MRADRLVSLVLLLRHRGQMSAEQLAQELECSVRTVFRDIESLSAAGVPVYAERGRRGGFALLPGFRTELTGLSHDEALALLASSNAAQRDALGLSTALASGTRKILDALPEPNRHTADAAAQRILLEPASDLLARRRTTENLSAAVISQVRTAVLTGRRLRMQYAAADADPRWRTVDPIGLVTVRNVSYLLALREGEDRTYRLSRIRQAQVTAEAARRPDGIDLDQLWRERSDRFRRGHEIFAVEIHLPVSRRGDLLDVAVDVLAQWPLRDGLLGLRVQFQDLRHAIWAIWQLGPSAEVTSPHELRVALYQRAASMMRRYGPDPQS